MKKNRKKKERRKKESETEKSETAPTFFLSKSPPSFLKIQFARLLLAMELASPSSDEELDAAGRMRLAVEQVNKIESRFLPSRRVEWREAIPPSLVALSRALATQSTLQSALSGRGRYRQAPEAVGFSWRRAQAPARGGDDDDNSDFSSSLSFLLACASPSRPPSPGLQGEQLQGGSRRSTCRRGARASSSLAGSPAGAGAGDADGARAAPRRRRRR